MGVMAPTVSRTKTNILSLLLTASPSVGQTPVCFNFLFILTPTDLGGKISIIVLVSAEMVWLGYSMLPKLSTTTSDGWLLSQLLMESKREDILP